MGGSHGRVGAGALLEREAELTALADTLARARAGEGAMLAIEGQAGVGKTSLLEAAAEQAAAAGMTVLAAQGEDLERGLPWGLARRLLGPALEHPANAAVLEGAAAPAAALFDRSDPTPPMPGSDAVLSVSHALLWPIANLAEEAPLVLCVDDGHWADDVSLRLLAYLLGRLRQLPVAVLLARRPRGAGVRRPLLEALFADPRVDCLAPAPLSREAVATIVERELGAGVDAALATACAEMTAGNPFYLHELLLELGSLPAGSLGPQALDRITLESVSRAVFVRLARLGPEAIDLARAAAILGEGASLAHATELAGLDPTSASRAFDALAIAEVLRPAEPLGFAHPLVLQALDSEIGAGERGELHRAAARLLARDGAGPEVVAVHLMEAGRQGEEWAVTTLREAAARSLAQGATETAAEWLGRALEEPAPAAPRGALLAELGRAEAALGRPGAIEHLRDAAELAESGEEAARDCADLGRALALQGRAEDAAAAFERGIEHLGDPDSELGKELRAAWWSAATLVATTRSEAMRTPEPRLPADGERPTPGERELLAQLAMQRAFEGHERAEVTALAERAWGEGELLATAPGDSITWSLVSGALLVADEFERGLEVCDVALADARRRGSPMAFANASYCHAWPLFALGRVNDAVADAEAALAARADGWSAFLGTGSAILAMGLIERGEPRQAREALALVDGDEALRASTQYPMILVASARLLVAEGRPADALAQLLGAGEMLTAAGMDCPSAVPWQADSALAAGLAGELEQARELAAGALAAARRGGAPTAIARALRAAARAERGERAIDLHREALATLDGLPPRLERTHALIDLGAALRRNRRRAEAREHLTQGLRQALDGGALALAETAEVELAAAGARTAKASADGVLALTPSERRVADMAAAGMSNRAIAQALFVTVKAVEYHLSNTYRKLNIDSRRELGPLLTGDRRDDGDPG
jgi:DNA-binding CsgD family transcriptional regulator